MSPGTRSSCCSSYDGRLHHFASGHYFKFEVKAAEKSRRVPHGIAYSLTLHAPDGKRLVEAERVLKEQGVAFEIVDEKEG